MSLFTLHISGYHCSWNLNISGYHCSWNLNISGYHCSWNLNISGYHCSWNLNISGYHRSWNLNISGYHCSWNLNISGYHCTWNLKAETIISHRLNGQSLKYPRLSRSSCKDVFCRKSEFNIFRCSLDGVTQSTANFDDCISGNIVRKMRSGTYDYVSFMHFGPNR